MGEKHPPLRDRDMQDANFAHTVKLCGACLGWAETVEIDHPLDWNDLNMIKIPAEILLAFLKREAARSDATGDAAREALALFQAFRALSSHPPKDAAKRKARPKKQLTLDLPQGAP